MWGGRGVWLPSNFHFLLYGPTKLSLGGTSGLPFCPHADIPGCLSRPSNGAAMPVSHAIWAQGPFWCHHQRLCQQPAGPRGEHLMHDLPEAPRSWVGAGHLHSDSPGSQVAQSLCGVLPTPLLCVSCRPPGVLCGPCSGPRPGWTAVIPFKSCASSDISFRGSLCDLDVGKLVQSFPCCHLPA